MWQFYLKKYVMIKNPLNPASVTLSDIENCRAMDIGTNNFAECLQAGPNSCSYARCHDGVDRRAVSGAGVRAGSFFAVFTPEQFCLKAVFGHEQRIYLVVLFHGAPKLEEG